MRSLLALFPCLIFGTAVHAQEICDSNKSAIHKEFRILESDLTERRALESLSFLTELTRTPNMQTEWMSAPNSLKIVEGYLLKKSYLESVNSDIHTRDRKQQEFCNWLTKEGFWYD